uniref:Putative ribosome-associated chaperone zuotin translation n=1 Tax=Hyalomma excavatum TaxID=257692 RepID=A0A131XFI1_9ACAR
MVQLLVLPPAPSGQSGAVAYGKLHELSQVEVEPVGRWFEAVYQNARTRHVSSAASIGSESSDEGEGGSAAEDPAETQYLLSLDPKEWKSQDHYRVLGLQSKRHAATEHDIKKAYRRKVLLHHPDKRRTAGEQVRDLERDYFSCITRAYEILGNPVRRRSYDSVDPEFDDDIPASCAESRNNFFATFRPVFEANARWSTKRNVPSLGDENSSRDEVDRFYHFWYSFDSWREYSYLDEEEKEKGENREERRWIEKQNRAARQKRKREEMQRIRQLVDTAYACDPRVQRFKEEERERKLAQKRARQEAARARQELEEKERQEREEAERLERERQEEDARQQREKERREKENLRKQLKKERKALESVCTEDGHYAVDAEEHVVRLQQLHRLCQLLSLEELQQLNQGMEAASNVDERKSLFLEKAKALEERLEREKAEQLGGSQSGRSQGGGDKGSTSSSSSWSPDDVQLLVKAVNLFPAGTANRWEVVAAFLNQHGATSDRTAKEVLAKAKSLQKLDPQLKEEANRKAYEQHQKSLGAKAEVAFKDESTPSQRFDGDGAGGAAVWQAEEQRLLEQALKTYPASTPDRWDRIAECVPTRSKKECMRRYKDLVELVKTKKAAQQAAAAAAQSGRK